MLSAINYYKYSIQLIQLIFNCNKHTGQKVCLDEIQVNKINKYKSNGLVDIKTRLSLVFTVTATPLECNKESIKLKEMLLSLHIMQCIKRSNILLKC